MGRDKRNYDNIEFWLSMIFAAIMLQMMVIGCSLTDIGHSLEMLRFRF